MGNVLKNMVLKRSAGAGRASANRTCGCYPAASCRTNKRSLRSLKNARGRAGGERPGSNGPDPGGGPPGEADRRSVRTDALRRPEHADEAAEKVRALR